MPNFRSHMRLAIAALASAPLLPTTAHALSYVSMPDAVLYDQASVVALAKVADVVPAQDSGLPATQYRLQVDERLKGRIADQAVVTVAGGTVDGQTLRVSGAPRFETSDQVLLFLRERGDGTYALTQFALGAFKVRHTHSGRAVAVRDLADAQALSLTTGKLEAGRDGLRDLQRFRAWLQERERGIAGPGDYWLGEEEAVGEVDAKYQLASTPPVRWAEFDEGRVVTIHAGSAGLLNLPGGGYAQVQQAISAWNDDAGSSVRLVYGGTTPALGGLSAPDGLNAVLFNDPDDVIGGAFDCLTGGILATTGTWVGSTRTWSGGTYVPLVEADTVVQDGVSCLLGLLGNANAAELFAHELGHALGLAHSCGDGATGTCTRGTDADDAVMRAVLHGDGRGASLGADDRAGVGVLYPASIPQPTAAPSAQPSTGASSDGGGGGGGGSLAVSTLLGLMLTGFGRRRLQRC